MSVNFAVRRLSARVDEAIRRDPSLTEPLCDAFTLDFDAADYERRAMEGVSPERYDHHLLSVGVRVNRQEAAQAKLFATLAGAGITKDDVERALDIERSWWGMEAMIDGEAGKRLIREQEGEAIGDDVGYGPARLFSELAPIVADLERVTRDDAEARFRVYETANNRAPTPCTDAEFESWSWQPFVRLREYVASAAQNGVTILRWYH